MVSFETFRNLALSLPEVTEEPHFDKTSFRVKKKIFATCDKEKRLATLKLSEIDQNVFSSIDKTGIYPVPNKWGKQGWTVVELKTIKSDLFTDALTTAYCEVAPKKLSEMVRPRDPS